MSLSISVQTVQHLQLWNVFAHLLGFEWEHSEYLLNEHSDLEMFQF